MSKYIRKFTTTAAGHAATDLLSPNVTYIEENGGKLLNIDCGDNVAVEITASGEIQRKA